ncbi:MAG: hypothetical protein QOI51_1871 [Nocardioidaceae bacterium]|jgi:hypothetical protein|nr:hypothetical protein [Nocardioidaceae bacterium]MDX6308665.1 hypothetical protein [Nocardioidaceae bacterium]
MSDAIRPMGDELVLSVIATVATLLVIPVIVVAGSLNAWMVVVVVLAAAMVYSRRDSAHGLAALGAIALAWIAGRPDPLSPWSVVIALLMFTVHGALALQTTAPPGAGLGRAVVTRWLVRSAVVAGITVVVYVVAVSLDNLHRSDGEAVLAAALALLGGLVLLLRQETLGGRRQGAGDRSP